MPAHVSKKETQRRFQALEKTKSTEHPNGSIVRAAKLLGDINATALSKWFRDQPEAPTVGRKPTLTKEECIQKLRELGSKLGRAPTRDDLKTAGLRSLWRGHWNNLSDFFKAAELDMGPKRDRLLSAIRQTPTLDELATKFGISRGKALDLCDELKRDGLNVFLRGDRVCLEAIPAQVAYDKALHLYESDANGKYRFGIVSDNHLGSRYAREDVLHELYDWFVKEGITRVYNGGNWIDGEASFNKHDLSVHGMDQQLAYFAKNYPQREGITTYYVAGDDHEGWYAKREGVDIGLRAQQTAESFGRKDLRYLGYMEAYITLKHAKTGQSSELMVVHPGGGTAYALSYSPQKWIEALQGGEKPAVIIFGHWHKMEFMNYRNVWAISAGTTEDQTPFMRKKRIEAHVGGLIVELAQNERGAIMECLPRFRRYFDRGYHRGDAYNMAGPIGERHEHSASKGQ